MHSKTLHSFLAIILIVIFQLPSWLQLEHSIHTEESIHICEAKGNTKHIHKESNNNCKYLHEQLNFHFTVEIAAFVFSPRTDFYAKVTSIVNKISLQAVLFSKLRAPPSLLF